mmetsp:Transcript_55749/g.110063  ORF Transcript_55749/g.110063 Transcript_55749/m.110063 type:complete len:99 (+) Transcript_55749:1197-1493(+)
MMSPTGLRNRNEAMTRKNTPQHPIPPNVAATNVKMPVKWRNDLDLDKIAYRYCSHRATAACVDKNAKAMDNTTQVDRISTLRCSIRPHDHKDNCTFGT